MVDPNRDEERELVNDVFRTFERATRNDESSVTDYLRETGIQTDIDRTGSSESIGNKDNDSGQNEY